MFQAATTDLVRHLQKQVLSLQKSLKPALSEDLNTGLGIIEEAFPDNRFPLGAVHELISYRPTDAAATNAFIAGILGSLMDQGGTCLWVGLTKSWFPGAMKSFGIEPHRIIFIDGIKPKEALWTIEEALKCDVLAGVVGELPQLSFVESRRLQLAVESSRVTGFIHRYNPKQENTTACVSRWKIRSLASPGDNSLPGVGHPRWNVELTKVRNGHPGSWDMEWVNNRFRHIAKPSITIVHPRPLKTG